MASPTGTPLLVASHRIAMRASLLFDRLRTAVYYRALFGAVGRGTIVQPPVLLANPHRIFLGNGVLIRRGARLEVIEAGGATPILSIGSNTNLEQNVHIVCRQRITIGDNVSITANCAIVDVTHAFDGLPEGAKIGEQIDGGPSFVEIGDGAFLGIGTVVLPNVRIGRRAVIGANSVVTHSIPDFACAAGAPARVLRVYRTPDQSRQLVFDGRG